MEVDVGPSSSSEPAQSTPPFESPGLASLPLNVLLEICHYAFDPNHPDTNYHQWNPRYKPRSPFHALRLCCKRLSVVLSDLIAPVFEIVSIAINADGLRLLGGIARGRLGKHVQHIVFTRGEAGSEQGEDLTAFLDSFPAVHSDGGHCPGLETQMAVQLADTLASLPALRYVTIRRRSLYGPTREYASRVRFPTVPYTVVPGFHSSEPMNEFGHSSHNSSAMLNDEDQQHAYELALRTETALFRSIILALAYARHQGILICSFSIEDWKAGPLDNAAYSFTPQQRELLMPMLAELRTLVTKIGGSSYQEFYTFLRMCPRLESLKVMGRGRAQAILGLVEPPVLVRRLKELQLCGYTLPPTVLIKLLSQRHLDSVHLRYVCLDKDTALARDDRGMYRKWIGYPVLWDAVLRTLSEAFSENVAEIPEQLVLKDVCEICEYNDEIRQVWFGKFGVRKRKIIVKNSTREAELLWRLRYSELHSDMFVESSVVQGWHLFHRAAGLLNPPDDMFPGPLPAPAEPILPHLPFDVLSIICEDLNLRDITNLRRCCKALAVMLIDELGSTLFRRVPIAASAAGVAILAEIASSPFGPYVQHVDVHHDAPEYKGDEPLRLAQLAFVGLDEGQEDNTLDTLPTPGPDTPFAQALGKVLVTLPALNMASVDKNEYHPMRMYRPFQLKMHPYGDKRNQWSRASRPPVFNAVFRGVLFALAYLYGQRPTAMTLEVGDPYAYDDTFGLDDSVFLLAPVERELVTPFLSSLVGLHLSLKRYKYRPKRLRGWKQLNAFIGLCSGITELSLDGVDRFKDDQKKPHSSPAATSPSASVVKLIYEPIPLPHLKKLILRRFTLHPSAVIHLLSQWSLSQITLREIRLNFGGLKWDDIMDNVSSLGTSTIHRLELQSLYQFSTRFNAFFYQARTLSDDDSDSDSDSQLDVFIRAAKRLRLPESDYKRLT